MSDDLPLTPDDVADIVAILDGSGYDRIDISTKRMRVRIVRDRAGWTQEWDLAADDAVVAAPDASDAEAALPEGLSAVRAPLPGTFYRAPQPGAPPFVAIGDRIGPDSVVGIVETMKLMNPVHAGLAGTIVAVAVADAAMVARGAVLLHVRPDAA